MFVKTISLESVEDALEAISEVEGKSLKMFQDQVEQNKEILAQLEQTKTAILLQNICTIVIRSDTNYDQMLNEEEMSNAIARFNGLEGVEFSEAAFREAMEGEKSSIRGIMKVIQNLLNSDVPRERSIFFQSTRAM